MSVTVKCKRGNCEMTFKHMKEGQIQHFDCEDACLENERGEKPLSVEPVVEPEVEAKPEVKQSKKSKKQEKESKIE